MRVLVVDDDALSRRLLGATLGKLGHEVIVAESGREGWAAFQEHAPPLVITDWIMEGIDGLGLCRLIRAERRAKYTYLMLLTVMEGKGPFLEGMEAGVDDFITKPFDPDELAARVRVAERVLGLQTQLKQLEGLLPICMYCKKIRDERGGWSAIEEYIGRRTDAAFSHGVCPGCFAAVLKPEIDAFKRGGG